MVLCPNCGNLMRTFEEREYRYDSESAGGGTRRVLTGIRYVCPHCDTSEYEKIKR